MKKPNPNPKLKDRGIKWTHELNEYLHYVLIEPLAGKLIFA